MVDDVRLAVFQPDEVVVGGVPLVTAWGHDCLDEYLDLICEAPEGYFGCSKILGSVFWRSFHGQAPDIYVRVHEVDDMGPVDIMAVPILDIAQSCCRARNISTEICRIHTTFHGIGARALTKLVCNLGGKTINPCEERLGVGIVCSAAMLMMTMAHFGHDDVVSKGSSVYTAVDEQTAKTKAGRLLGRPVRQPSVMVSHESQSDIPPLE